MRVSVVIPNWNGAHLLKDCLTSLRNQTFTNFELIIIDNGSTDESIEVIEKTFPKAIVIKLEKNIGFSPAVNLGIKKASGEYIILLNNDTKADKDAIKYLVKTASEHQDVGMVTAKLLNFHKPDLIDAAGDYIDSVGHGSNIGLGEKDGEKFNQPGHVFTVTGGGSLFKKEVFEKVGFFDDDYFDYF